MTKTVRTEASFADSLVEDIVSQIYQEIELKKRKQNESSVGGGLKCILVV